MKALLFLTPAFLLVGAAGMQQAGLDPGTQPAPFFTCPAQASRAVISVDAATSGAAVAYLRGFGIAGIEALRQAYSPEVSFRLGEGEAPGHPPEVSERILRAFDSVSGQHDGWASGLYWHTDRARALADARESGLPILNLWLLGRLDDEFC